jgi:AbrB family looped-hinge helix DNA binding protein
MDTVTVSSKGQVVIPRSVRRALHIVAGTQFAISADANEIRLHKIESAFPRTEPAAGRGLLAKPGRQLPDAASLKARIGAHLAAKDAASKSKTTGK